MRVLALLYGAAVVEGLAVTGGAPTELALVLVAFAAGLSWRVPGRVQGWTADVGEAVALGSALLLLVVVVPERAQTIALVAYVRNEDRRGSFAEPRRASARLDRAQPPPAAVSRSASVA